MNQNYDCWGDGKILPECLLKEPKKIRCLKVNEPFASMIVKGQKVWELRSQKTNIREKIAIGTNGKVIGYADLCDCWFESIEIIRHYNQFHLANEFLFSYGKGKSGLYIWHMRNASIEPKPYPYSYSTGSWCTAFHGVEIT